MNISTENNQASLFSLHSAVCAENMEFAFLFSGPARYLSLSFSKGYLCGCEKKEKAPEGKKQFSLTKNPQTLFRKSPKEKKIGRKSRMFINIKIQYW